MATKKEIKEHLKIALEEVGEILPWFDEEVDAWVFGHKAYPVEYAGESPEEVIKNYPLYLYDFIEARLSDNLNPMTEKSTKGRGGRREGAGRPVGTKKEPTSRIVLPKDVADWIKKPESISKVRRYMRSKKKAHN
jgi:hypothetical protein